MFNLPALTWTLTAVLLLGAGYNLAQVVRARHLTDRVNNTLHALMHTLMAAMLWDLAPATTLAQITLLAGAALWFTLQAVARPQFKLLCAGTQGRLKCAYHSATMAAAAIMIAMMAQAGPASPGTVTAKGALPSSHVHHAMPSSAQIPALPSPALLLTALFTAAAVMFTFLLIRGRVVPKANHHAPASKAGGGAEHALEAIGAAVMAVMFSAMTA